MWDAKDRERSPILRRRVKGCRVVLPINRGSATNLAISVVRHAHPVLFTCGRLLRSAHAGHQGKKGYRLHVTSYYLVKRTSQFALLPLPLALKGMTNSG